MKLKTKHKLLGTRNNKTMFNVKDHFPTIHRELFLCKKYWFYTSLPNLLQKVLDRISETISDVEIFFINPAFARTTNQNLFFVKLPGIQIHRHNGGLENENGYIHSFHLLFCDCDKCRVDKF